MAFKNIKIAKQTHFICGRIFDATHYESICYI
jgi:hypothetical protein